MATYQFNCVNPQCTEKDKVVDINMKMSEYTSEGHYCKVCNQPLSRTVSSLVCGYQNNKDFCGKCH